MPRNTGARESDGEGEGDRQLRPRQPKAAKPPRRVGRPRKHPKKPPPGQTSRVGRPPIERQAKPNEPPKVTAQINAALDKDRSQFPAQYAAAKEWAEENLVSISDDEFKSMLPDPEFDVDWVQTDENELQVWWDAHPERIERLAYHETGALVGLWKACLVFMRCHPWDIVSTEFGLRHDTSENGHVEVGDVMIKTPRMSDNFCQRLRTLVCHPFFEGSKGLLATCIQYAVICRTNDMGPWNLRSFTVDTEPFIEAFDAHMDADGNDEKPKPTLHQELIANLAQLEGQSTPRLSRVFTEIEKRAWKGGDNHKVYRGPYRVLSRDLTTIVKALNSLLTYGFPSFPDAETWETLVTELYPNNVPPRRDMLTEAVESAYWTKNVEYERERMRSEDLPRGNRMSRPWRSRTSMPGKNSTGLPRLQCKILKRV